MAAAERSVQRTFQNQTETHHNIKTWKSGHETGATNIKLVLPLFMLYLFACAADFVGLDLEWKDEKSPLSSDPYVFCLGTCLCA